MGNNDRENAYKRGMYIRSLADAMDSGNKTEMRERAQKYEEASGFFAFAKGYRDSNDQMKECDLLALQLRDKIEGRIKKKKQTKIGSIVFGDESIASVTGDMMLKHRIEAATKDLSPEEAERVRNQIMFEANTKKYAYNKSVYEGDNPTARFFANFFLKRKFATAVIAFAVMYLLAMFFMRGTDSNMNLMKLGAEYDNAFFIAYRYAKDEISRGEAAHTITQETIFDEETAFNQIDCLRAMLRGELFTGKADVSLVEKYLIYINALEGGDAVERAFDSVQQHIEYIGEDAEDARVLEKIITRTRTAIEKQSKYAVFEEQQASAQQAAAAANSLQAPNAPTI